MELRILVADSVNVLADKKLAAMGIYADNHIITDGSQSPELIEAMKDPDFKFGSNVDIVLTLSGLPNGHHSCDIQISQDGNADVLGKPYSVEFDVIDEGSTNLILQFKPLALHKPGVLDFTAQIGELSASCQMKVSLKLPPGTV